MRAKAWVQQHIARLWAKFAVQYGMAASACGLAIWMQYQYRLEGSWIFLVLPVIGVLLLMLNVLMIVNEFTGSLPKWDPIRRLLKHAQFTGGLLVRTFVYTSLLWYANGILDGQPPVYRAALIDSEAWTKSTGFAGAYAWVTLRYRDAPDQLNRVLITGEERQMLWGAQPVSVTLKQGLFGVPSVVAIEQDWGWYGGEILKLAPTATMIMQRKLHFDLSHNRWEEGIAAGHRYLELNPSDWETAIMAGALLFNASRYHDSLPFYELGVKQHPIYSNMQQYGTALNWAGQSPHAAEVFKASIPLDPDNWEAYYHLGYVYGDMGDYEEAIRYFQESLKRRPGSLEINMMVAKHRQDIQHRDQHNLRKPKKTALYAPP